MKKFLTTASLFGKQGLTDNFPIWIFVDKRNRSAEVNPKTPGVRIDSWEQIEQYRIEAELIQLPIDSFDNDINRLCFFFIENLKRSPDPIRIIQSQYHQQELGRRSKS